MTQTQVVVGIWFMGALVILVSAWLLFRDILTHAYYQSKSKDHIVAEFLSKVGLAFVEVVKIENQDTGQFTYKGRMYFTGKEKVLIAYPPGRSPRAQVNMQKCYPNAASSDMATTLHGKPTVDNIIVYAIANQKDTTIAMERSEAESGGGNSAKKIQMWTWIALGALGVIGAATLIFIIKGQGTQDSILSTLQQIGTAMGVK